MTTIPFTLDFFAQHAINRRPTLHDIIHYVAWMGYIQETKYYPSTCLEAANNIEFAFANSRATYGKTQSTRLHAVCANAWSSQYTKEQQAWADKTEDHARWGTIHYEPNSWRRTWTPINVRQAKFDVEWRKTRVQNLMSLAAAYAKNNLPNVVNQKNSNGYSALHGAVYSGNLELVKLLLDAGAYPEGDLPVLYDYEFPPHNGPAVPRRALQPAHRSANCLQPFLHRKTTLTVAIEKNHGHIVAELVRRGHRLDISDFRGGLKPFERAIKTNALSCVKALLNAGVSTKGSLFHAIAIREDPTPMISLLCSFGADPNETDGYQRTPLMIAAGARPFGAYGQHLEHTIKPLVKVGTLINMRDHLGQTALFLAAAQDNVEIVKELLDCNIDTQLVDHFGNRAIDIVEDDKIKILLARADLKRRFKGSKKTR
jgi:hypothetical protein